jgi:hypothetical protein
MWRSAVGAAEPVGARYAEIRVQNRGPSLRTRAQRVARKAAVDVIDAKGKEKGKSTLITASAGEAQSTIQHLATIVSEP